MSQPYSGTGDLLLLLYSPGDRVELAPHTELWARGERFGTVAPVESLRFVHVTLDRSGKTVRVAPENIARKVDRS